MFEYNYNSKLRILDITLPKMLKYNFIFMDSVNELINCILNGNREYSKIRISCKHEPFYDKMCKAYLFNVLRHLAKNNIVLWSTELNAVITSSVVTKEGSKFSEINIEKAASASELNDYRFSNQENVNKPVEEIVNLIVEKNFTLNRKLLKEFLTTTIGEIFSNAFLHSDRKELYFIYDIEKVNDDFFLCVTVIDYGNTIVHNVKEFYKKSDKEFISSTNCLEWAIKKGNTTRDGSGGYGLPTLIDYITRAKGELIILSGDTCYNLVNTQKHIEKSNGYFCGTSAMFRIKLFEMDNIIWYDKSKDRLTNISLNDL